MTGLEGICAIAGVRLNDNGISEITSKPFRDAQRDPYDSRRRAHIRRGPEPSPAAELSVWIRRVRDWSVTDNVSGNDRCQGDHIRRRCFAAPDDNTCAGACRCRYSEQQECSGGRAQTVPHNCRKSIIQKPANSTGEWDVLAGMSRWLLPRIRTPVVPSQFRKPDQRRLTRCVSRHSAQRFRMRTTSCD